MVILVGFAALRIIGWFLRVDTPWVWDYGPAWNAFIVHLYRTGLPLYPDPSQFRSATIYTPLVLLVTSVIAPLFGHGALAALAAGRSLVMLSTLVACVMIFMLARRFGASGAASLIVSLAFLCAGLLQTWGFEFRVDMPALAFELTALWVFQAGYGFTAVVLCVLAFFSKQSSVAAIGAITLFSWLDGKRGQAGALAGFWLAAVGLLTLLAQWAWPFYLTNTVRALSADYLDAWAAPTFLAAMVYYDIGISILAVCALLNRRVNRLALLFLAIAALENIASCTRWGSNIYYFLPTLAALTIVAAPQMDALLEDFAKFGRFGQAVCGVIVALIILLGSVSAFSPIAWIRLTYRYHAPWDATSLHRLRSISGPVLTDWGSLVLVDNSPKLTAMDLALAGVMRRSREFNDRRLLTAVRCREFAAIALDRSGLKSHYRGRMFLWPKLREAILANYTPVASSGPPFLMLPRAGRGCTNQSS